MSQKFPTELQHLIDHLKKLPGVGSKTAERFAFEIINWPEEEMRALGKTFFDLKEKISPCPTCGCLTQEKSCTFCENGRRDRTKLCILASARDVYAIEETQMYQGLYHVVEHLLSPIEGRHAHELSLERITKRIERDQINEVVIAFDSTLEGDTTALYLKKHLARPQISLTRLAFGLPVGSCLEYVDGGTLIRAFAGRQNF